MDFVVIGGVAATLQGSDQITQDLDIAHEHSSANLERLVDALLELDATRITVPGAFTEPRVEDLANRIEQFVSPIGNIDLFFDARSIGGYADIIDAADEISLGDGVTIQVASIDHIIQSKAGSGRDKDPNHIRSLERLKELLAKRRIRGESSP